MKKGFTLIELMIVLAIIAILAAVAIPLYDWYKRRTIVAEAQQELMTLSTVQEDYFNSFRRYANAATLRGFYGVKAYTGTPADEEQGKHFRIDVTNPTTTSFTATASVCFNKPGTACNSGNKDTTCTIANGADQPTCESY
jgi:prepilin-type N-terminal cleavage/methylation domain-containing protein